MLPRNQSPQLASSSPRIISRPVGILGALPALTDERRPDLTQRDVVRLYLPLAVSWLMMAVEGPVSTAVTSRLPDARVQTAGIFVVMGLAIFIESPVIDLLTASTTLGKGRRSFEVLRRYALIMMGLVTVVHAAVAFTPLFDFILLRLLNVPPEVTEASRLPFQIMTPWSALIGWRRHLQGLMIRNGESKPIGVGSAIRAVVLAGTCFGGFLVSSGAGGSIPGLVVVAYGLVASVAAESLFIHFAARPVLREHYALGEAGPALPWRDLLAFHWPLVASTAVMMTAAPMMSGAMARMESPVLSMAGWQTASSILFLFRTVTFALPEAVIALYRDEASAKLLRSFCIKVGAVCSATLLAMSLSGADKWVFVHVLDAQPDVAYHAHLAFLFCGLQPLINALMSYNRALLTAHRKTVARTVAVLTAIGVLLFALELGVRLDGVGVIVAAVAATTGQLAELFLLATWLRRVPHLEG